MTLKELCEKAHANSRDKGWYDVPHDKRNIGEMLMLIVTEVAEAMEDYRDGNMWEAIPNEDPPGKPTGFVSEIADIVIRIGDLCGYLGIDLDGAVQRKMAYNATRSHRHGGKRA
jgi:NTP pyrophosphatase (non-canonical NTP hydrolase)